MNKNEIRHKLNDEIGAINLVIDRLQRIYKRNPDSSNAQDAIYVINVLTNVKNDMLKTSNEIKKEIYEQPAPTNIEDENVLVK